ncbi:hypothetical protein KKA69_00880 [Patescibacteria group bacterium]|nr:hypothetical protein [Patescibacteria group bacterium]
MNRGILTVVVILLAAVLPFQLSAAVIPDTPFECPTVKWVSENISHDGDTSKWIELDGCGFAFDSRGGSIELTIPAGSLMTGWDPRPEPEGQKNLLVEGPGVGNFWTGTLWIVPQPVTNTPTSATAEPTATEVPTPEEYLVFIPLVFSPPLPRLPIPDRPDGCPSIDWLNQYVGNGTWSALGGCGFEYDSGGSPVMLAVPKGVLVTGWNPILGENLEFRGPGHVKVWTATLWFP